MFDLTAGSGEILAWVSGALVVTWGTFRFAQFLYRLLKLIGKIGRGEA